MQLQSSSAPQHIATPPPSPREVPAPPPDSRRRLGWWIGLIVVSLLVGGAIWRWHAVSTDDQAARQEVAAVRTATVITGVLERTIRLSGVTAAERYSSLNAPQLRGRRSGFTLSQYTSGVDMNKTVRSNDTSAGGSRTSDSSSGSSSSSAANTTSNASSAASGSDTSSSSSGTSASTSTSASGGSSISTSRFTPTSSPGASSRSAALSIAGSSTDPASSAMGAGGLGSTASGIPNSGGGGGGNDYMTVLQRLIKPGSAVKHDDVVAEFDRQYMTTRLDDYKANVAQAEASFRKMKAELAVEWKAQQQSIAAAQSAWEKALLDLQTRPVQSAITSEIYELAASQAEASLKELRGEAPLLQARELAQVRNAEIELMQARNELRRAQRNVDRMEVKAPIHGITVMQPMFRGSEFSTIQQGDQLYPGQLFMQVVDTSSMVVNATVNQVDVEKIRMGARARVRFDAYPDLELPAHVYSVGALGKISRYRASFISEVPIRLKLEKLDPRVIPDLSVSADVILETEQDATLAPLESIFSDAAGKSPFVFVKNQGGWQRRPVSLGPADNTTAVVRSGLRPGEVIAAEWPVGEAPK